MKSSNHARIVLFISVLSVFAVGLSVSQDVSPEDIMPQFDASVTIANVSYGDEDEWVEITNPGMATQDFTYWSLADEDNITYFFPTGFTLAPGEAIKVHTGMGNDTATDLYWTNEEPILEEDEVVTLLDATGEVVSRYP